MRHCERANELPPSPSISAPTLFSLLWLHIVFLGVSSINPSTLARVPARRAMSLIQARFCRVRTSHCTRRASLFPSDSPFASCSRDARQLLWRLSRIDLATINALVLPFCWWYLVWTIINCLAPCFNAKLERLRMVVLVSLSMRVSPSQTKNRFCYES